MSLHLNGCKVLVTRPGKMGEQLCRLIQSDGGIAIELPTLELSVSKLLNRQGLFDLVASASHILFVSRNAVQFAWQLAGDLTEPLRNKVILAVGEGTRKELAELNINNVVSPGLQSGSEELLALPQLGRQRIYGRTVLIVRGDSGRELLQKILQARGAIVKYADVYQRTEPAVAMHTIHSIWHQSRPDVIVATSKQGLLNLIKMTEEPDRVIMFGKKLVVMSSRIAEAASQAGFVHPAFIADAQSDQGLLQAIRQTVE